MKNLIEISKIVTKKKVKKIEIFDDHSLKHKNSKFNEFYEALQANKFRNDRDAATFLYDCSPTDDKYRQLKSRFRKRLLNTLFFLDVNLPSTSSYDRAYYSCNKDWTLVKILISNGADATAQTQARSILTTALKYKFADVIVNCARILRRYAAENGEEKYYEEYDRHIKQYSNVLEAEIRSEELYQRVIINYPKPESENENLSERIDTYCEALVGLSEMYDSPVVAYNMYLVWTFRYEMLREYDAMLEVCDKAIHYIESDKNVYQAEKLATFLLKKMTAYLHLRDWTNGQTNAERASAVYETGSREWYTFMEYYFLLAMYTENYLPAMAILNRAMDHARFRKLPTMLREKWRIFEMYLHFIAHLYGNDMPVLAQQKRKTFRLNRFLEETFIYSKEQRIYTIHMLVGQVLFYVLKNERMAAHERVEKLKSYANRQLRREEYYRTVQFIRMLQQFSKADFQLDALTSNTKYYDRLVEHPHRYRGLIVELEVIPYEKLWNLMLEMQERFMARRRLRMAR